MKLCCFILIIFGPGEDARGKSNRGFHLLEHIGKKKKRNSRIFRHAGNTQTNISSSHILILLAGYVSLPKTNTFSFQIHNFLFASVQLDADPDVTMVEVTRVEKTSSMNFVLLTECCIVLDPVV